MTSLKLNPKKSTILCNAGLNLSNNNEPISLLEFKNILHSAIARSKVCLIPRRTDYDLAIKVLLEFVSVGTKSNETYTFANLWKRYMELCDDEHTISKKCLHNNFVKEALVDCLNIILNDLISLARSKSGSLNTPLSSDVKYLQSVIPDLGKMLFVDGTVLPLTQKCRNYNDDINAAGRKRGEDKNVGHKAHAILDASTALFENISATAATGSETKECKRMIKHVQKKDGKSNLYVFDKGYTDFQLFKQIDDNNDLFAIRAKSSLKLIIVNCYDGNGKERKELIGKDFNKLTYKDIASNAKLDAIVRLNNGLEVRAIRNRVPSSSKDGQKIASKAKNKKSGQKKEMSIILTNIGRKELPCGIKTFDIISYIYRCRWAIESFFKNLKQGANFRRINCFKDTIITTFCLASLCSYVIKNLCASIACKRYKEDYGQALSISMENVILKTHIQYSNLLTALVFKGRSSIYESLKKMTDSIKEFCKADASCVYGKLNEINL